VTEEQEQQRTQL